MTHSRLFAFAAAAICAYASYAYNPYLPLWEHIPDGEPYVFEDPDNPGQYRVYVYGSHDSLRDAYCGREQVVWSAPVEDLSAWRYDGVIFENKTNAKGKLIFADGVGDVLYAPDVAVTVDKKGKKTYWLYPNVQGERNSLIAKSDRPDGPFKTCNWSKNNPNLTEGCLAFDPAVFVDDDGRVYGYWGFEKSYAAELDPKTMASVKPGTEIVEDLVSARNQDGIFQFFEASSIRKIQDKYVFVYSRWTPDGEFGLPGTNYTLAYAYSDNPLGPYTYGGTLIDGRGREKAPDGSTIHTACPSGNTHGGICEINGQWYVFYHRQAGLDEFARQAMVAPITVEVTPGPGGKVSISEAEFTSEGFEINGLDLRKKYPAGIACHYTGNGVSYHDYPKNVYYGPYIETTYWEGDPAQAPSDFEMHAAPVVHITPGSIVGYKYFNFDTAEGADSMDLSVNVMPLGQDALMTVMVGNPSTLYGGRIIGTMQLGKDEAQEITEKTIRVSGLQQFSGKQPLYFVFSSPAAPEVSLCKLYDFQFK